MRKALIITALVLAGLAPLVRYHPDVSSAPPSPPVVAAPPSPGTSRTPGIGCTRTVDGSVEDTEFGPYQVRVTFSGTTITDVQIITEPGDGHSQRIASGAEPTLRTEALQAQSGAHRHGVRRDYHQRGLRGVAAGRDRRERGLRCGLSST